MRKLGADMIRYFLILISFATLALGFVPSAAEAKCGRDLSVKSLDELPVFSGAPTSADYAPVCDDSDNRIERLDLTNTTIGGAFNGTVGATTPGTGAFTSITATADVSGDGTDQLFGFLQDQVASTTTSITAAQCGKTFVSNSADVLTLPEASTVLGCRLSFVCGTADDFDVNPADGTDQITSVSTTNGTTGVVTLAPSAGDAIRCTDIGGAITLEAVGANAWSQVAGGNGIWTDVN